MDRNSLILILIVGVVLVAFLKEITKNEKKLFHLLLTALLLHLGLLAYMQFDLHRYYHPDVLKSKFFNDGECYSSNAYVISNTLRDKKVKVEYFYDNPGIEFLGCDVFEAAQKMEVAPIKAYQVGYFAYFYSVLYAAYGYAPAFLNFLNIIAHILAAVLIFAIAKQTFSRPTAYLATVFFLFWPTIFYYSTTKVKEPMFIFLVYLLIFMLLRLDLKNTKQALLTLIAGALILLFVQALRDNIAIILLPVIILYLLLKTQKGKHLVRLLIIPITVVVFLKREVIALALKQFFITCAIRHKGFLESGGFVYQLYGSFSDVNCYNFLNWIAYFLRGWYHLIFEPLFSTGISFSFIAYYPFKLIFIILIFLAFLGMILSLKEGKRGNFLLVGFFLTYGSVLALVEGNVGTMIRHRDLIAPIVFIYSAFFISSRISIRK